MENKRKNDTLLVQGTILAMAGIIVRLISIIYRIPMTNIIGDEGNGYYSSAYQVYSIILLLSSYSLPQAVSRLVSQRLVKHQYRNANRIFVVALFFAVLSGGFFAALLYFGADLFAQWVHMPLAKISIQLLAPTVFVVGFLSVFRGFFQGFRTMVPTAVSQVVEQIVNAIVSIVCVIIFSAKGHETDIVKNTGTSYLASCGAAGATLGTFAGALAGLLCILLFFRYTYPQFKNRMHKEPKNHVFGYGKIAQMLIATSVPIVISAVIFNMVTVVDNIVLSQSLAKRDVAKDIIASKWGVFAGKYLLLINIPIAFATALSSSAIPAIAQANEQKNKGELIHRIHMVEKFTLILAIPCAFGLAILAKPIIQVLFPSDHSNATNLLYIGTASVVFFSIATITNAIFHGMGRMMLPIKNSAIAFLIHLLVLAIMTFGLHWDEYAVVISYMVFGLVVCYLNLLHLSRITRSVSSFMDKYLMPLLSALIMSVFVFGFYQLLQAFLWRWVALGISVLIGMLVYLIAVIKLRVIEEDEFLEFPFGRSILRFAYKFHLIKE